MKKIESIHNKTKEIEEGELPYNNINIILTENDLRKLFDENGLEGIQFNNINLYRNAFIHKSYCFWTTLSTHKLGSLCFLA